MTADRSNGRQIEGWALDRVVYTKGKCNLAWGFFESRGAAEDEADRLGVRVVWATLILPADVDVDASPTVSAAERAAVEWLDRAIRNCIPDIAEYARTIKAMLERRSPPCAGTGVEITPAMLKAAWVEVRKWWPLKVVEFHDCNACKQTKGLRVVETCIRVDEPQPGFREAIRAAHLYRRGEVGR